MKIIAQVEQTSPVAEFANALLIGSYKLHLIHLQTRSFAQHSALSFYEDLAGMADEFIEQYQGLYNLITTYPQASVVNDKDPVVLLQSLHETIQRLRKQTGFPQDSCLQNKIDEIEGGIARTLYKLRFLA